jgi:hypothetical protein
MNLMSKAMNVRFLIRLYYDRTPSRNIRTSTCESVLFHGPRQAVDVNSLATSGQISESLDDAVQLAKGYAIWQEAESREYAARWMRRFHLLSADEHYVYTRRWIQSMIDYCELRVRLGTLQLEQGLFE